MKMCGARLQDTVAMLKADHLEIVDLQAPKCDQLMYVGLPIT